ncbi:MAG: hypothetical protein KJ970_11430 [Candidatus Eisenbacteria bacterium]|uniref:6-bladed beta-propeller n=1 Tax=Eiseniibacteriota bacterium TaxID=2212470 RepID=A0A948RXT6_UNCEI|nr:hypothetical protein [Candidatus Eisenbacteria bacterium]MBU2691528.1 hypothetical protein [Candidatus Eisenbacteria bacterium]
MESVISAVRCHINHNIHRQIHRHAHIRGAILCLIGAAILLTPSLARPEEEALVNGVVHIRNGSTPQKGIDTYHLEELWRLGGADDETIFGLISQVISDSEGNLYLLDTQLSEIRVISPDGAPLGTLSHEGDGPGEVRQPFDLDFMPDGTLGMAQMFPGKIVKVDKEGHPAGDLAVGGQDPTQGGFAVLLDVSVKGGNLFLAGINITMAEGIQNLTSFLSKYAETGEEKVRYLEKATTLDFSNIEIIERDRYFVFPRRWDVDAEGNVYAAAERDRYAIHVWTPDGTLKRVIEREFQPWKRNEKDLGRIQAVMNGQTSRFPTEVKTEIEEYEVAINTIHIDGDGMIWVISSRGNHDQPDGIMQTYDLFSPEGHFVRQVAIACEGRGEDDGLIFVENDRVVLVKGLIDAAVSLQGGVGAGEDDEAEPMEVICYRIQK